MKKLLHSIILITCSIYVYSQQGYTINSIKLFEQGTTQPKVADRFYTSTFYKEFTRYISVEVYFTNHLYEKKQKHAIKFIWYDAQGIVLGKQVGKIQIQSDWTTSYYTNGWGCLEPGKWSTGRYKVDIYIDNSKVAEKSFLIKDKEYSVKDIKNFGFSDTRPVLKNRIYSNTFNTDSLKRLSIEINFNNLLFEKEDQKHPLMLKWYTADGETDGKQNDTVKISSEWKSSLSTSNGWGYSELGKWNTGKYKVEVYLDNYLIETHTLEIKNTEQINAKIAVRGNDLKVLVMQKPTEERLYNSLIESDVKPVQAHILASLVAGKNTTVYKVGKSLFIGTEEQIKAGNYEVAIVSSFGSQFSDITSISEYQDGNIKNTILEDGRIIEYKNGSLLDFTVTTTEKGKDDKPLKYFIIEYQNGKVFGSALYLTTIKDFSLQYDPSGNLRNMEQLRNGSGGSYSLIKLGSRFKIINRSDPSEVYFFDRNGRAILPVNETAESNIDGQQETVGFDNMQDMIINIPEYGTSWNKTIHLHNIQKVSVTIGLNEFGELSRSNTHSTGTGEVVGPQINYTGSAVGQVWLISNYCEVRTVAIDDNKNITLVMNKSAALSAPWIGVKGNKIYTEVANGSVRHTSWQKTCKVKLENGMLARMTVRRALPKEAPWSGELRGNVYTELENGLFRKTGQTKVVTHEIDGAVFNIKAYARARNKTEDGADVKWSYLFEGKIYEQGKDNNFICTREHRYDIRMGEIVTMSRDVQLGENEPWSFTTINGDGYLQNEAGTFGKVSETVYIFHEGERVAAIHDLRNGKFTLSNGVSFRLQ